MEQKLIDANKVDRIFLRARGIDDTCIGIYEQILDLPAIQAIPIDRVKQLRKEMKNIDLLNIQQFDSNIQIVGDVSAYDLQREYLELIDNLLAEYKERE